MKFTLCLTHRKQTASFRIASWLLAIAPPWLMLAAANTSAYAQTSDKVSNASATTSTAPSPADWTQFLRDNMQRWNPYETILNVNNVGGLKLLWKNPVNPPSSFAGISSNPAVVNGVVYAGTYGMAGPSGFGSNGSMYALNAVTGAKLWSFATAGPVLSSPAVANGVVYFGSDDYGVYALNAATGALLWSLNAGSSVMASPTVANGVVYIGSSGLLGYPDFNVTTAYLYALNAGTGALLWSLPGGLSPPAVVNGVVYGGCSDSLCALNASTGTKLWSFATAGPVYSSPAVANGVVYVSSTDGNLYALNASTGAKLWNNADAGGSTPAVANGVVYVASADDNSLYALNASTGAKLWNYTAGGCCVSSPAVANGVVYDSDSLSLYALNASTGAKLWSYAAAGYPNSPVVVNGVVYLALGNYVYAFSLAGASADLFLRIRPTTTTVHQGDLITYAFPVWNLGPDIADQEVLNTQVPEGTVFDYIRISGTPGLGTCSYTPYLGAGPIPIVCNQNGAMALNTTWTVRLTVKVTAPAGTVITENAATMADTADPNMANNAATVSLTVVP